MTGRSPGLKKNTANQARSCHVREGRYPDAGTVCHGPQSKRTRMVEGWAIIMRPRRPARFGWCENGSSQTKSPGPSSPARCSPGWTLDEWITVFVQWMTELWLDPGCRPWYHCDRALRPSLGIFHQGSNVRQSSL